MKRVSRNLNGGITQRLAVLAADLGKIWVRVHGPPARRIQQERSESQAVEVSKLRNRTGRTAHFLHTSSLDDLGLAVAVRSLPKNSSPAFGAYPGRRIFLCAVSAPRRLCVEDTSSSHNQSGIQAQNTCLDRPFSPGIEQSNGLARCSARTSTNAIPLTFDSRSAASRNPCLLTSAPDSTELYGNFGTLQVMGRGSVPGIPAQGSTPLRPLEKQVSG
jgi:hypothetical protein